MFSLFAHPPSAWAGGLRNLINTLDVSKATPTSTPQSSTQRAAAQQGQTAAPIGAAARISAAAGCSPTLTNPVQPLCLSACGSLVQGSPPNRAQPGTNQPNPAQPSPVGTPAGLGESVLGLTVPGTMNRSSPRSIKAHRPGRAGSGRVGPSRAGDHNPPVPESKRYIDWAGLC